MANENLNDLTREELIELCQQQEDALKTARQLKEHFYTEYCKLSKKLQTLKNIIEL